MNKQEIFDAINEVIQEENGTPISMDDKLIDSDLDSLGITIVLVSLDIEFSMTTSGHNVDDLDLQNLTMRELVSKCRLSTTPPN